MNNKKNIWVAVVDGEQARFFNQDVQKKLEEMEFKLISSHKRTDSITGHPLGRAFGTNHSSSSRSSIEPHTSNEELEKKLFAHEIAAYLQKSLDEHLYTKLILVAAPKMLGLLRKELNKSVVDVVIYELDKDFIHMSTEKIHQRLEDNLKFGVA